MNKTELISAIAEQSGQTKKDTSALLDAFVEVVTNELVMGGEVILTGFGKFTVVERSARTGRNPQTGEEIQIEETKTPKFRAGKSLKDAIK